MFVYLLETVTESKLIATMLHPQTVVEFQKRMTTLANREFGRDNWEFRWYQHELFPYVCCTRGKREGQCIAHIPSQTE
jgi:hypothetical protein